MEHFDIAWKYSIISPHLDERQRRLFAATEAMSLGIGGATEVAAATGISRQTIQLGIREIRCGIEPDGRIRRAGGGRKLITETQPGISDALEKLVDPVTRGDPDSPLRWTTKSTERLAEELGKQGFTISHAKVGALLREQGYSLQANKKTLEGLEHPDRDAQFQHINAQVALFISEDQPVISVDTKKKELAGDFKNAGSEWEPKGQPREVRTHDFEDKKLGKAIPYGVYDLEKNEGWVNVGTDHDTSAFAVESIWQWWKNMGQQSHPGAKRILICADSGGSNSSRCRLWKSELQDLSDLLQMEISVCHFPPGTSKWNKIEHRLFSSIAMNWRGRPLETHDVILNCIRGTTNKSGLRVDARLDQKSYARGVKIGKARMAELKLVRHEFHGEWNYVLSPRMKQTNVPSCLRKFKCL